MVIDQQGVTPPPQIEIVDPPEPPPAPIPPEVDNCQALAVTGQPQPFDCDQFRDDYCGLVFPEELGGQADAPMLGIFQECVSCSGEYAVAISGDCVEAPPPVPPQDETCYTCHAPENYDGRNSVENPHPWVGLTCTECHGGDAQATNPTFAHVCPPPEVGNRQQQVFDNPCVLPLLLDCRRAVVRRLLLPNPER